MPSRNVSVTASCGACAGPLPEGRARVWCSDACRQAAWRRRHQPDLAHPEVPPNQPRRSATVYACDACEARQIASQRCDGCGTFMRRLGTGGLCPCCDEPITFDEILQG